MDTLAADLRQAVRHVRRSPLHALAIIASVALGVAAVTAVFTVLDAVVLRPLSHPQADRLVMLYETNTERGWDRAEVAPANFLDWRAETSAFEDITAFQDWIEEATLTGEGEPRTLSSLAVFGSFFDVLRARPALGRLLREEESWSGADAVVVLSHAAWQRHFGGAADIVGRRIMLDGAPRTVIGVLAEEFREPPVLWSSPSALAPAADVFVPFGWDPAEVASQTFFRQAHTIGAIGRLAAGATVADAVAELGVTARRLEAAYPATNRAMGAGALPLREWIVEDGRTPLLLLLGAAVLVLLLTCANVANLMLANASSRAREMAVRSALGGHATRLARQVLAEAAVLGVAGGIAGLVVAAWTIDALLGLAPGSLPRIDQVGVDLRAFGVAMAVSLIAAIGFGLAPALGAARPRPDLTLRGGGATEARGRRRAGATLIGVQVALAVAVLAGAGLLFRTFAALRAVDPGFATENVLSFQVAAPASRYPGIADAHALQQAVLERVRELPGVESAALVSRMPLTGGWTSDASVENEPRATRNVRHREVSPGYFAAIGTPLVAGREFTASDNAASPSVVIVNRALARLLFPDEDPIGRRMSFDYEPGPDTNWRVIVGVVENTRSDGLRAEPVAEAFGAVLQDGGRTTRVVLRTAVPPASIVPHARAALRELDPDIPLLDVRTVQDELRTALARERFLLVLLGTFATLALALAAVGVYGTTAHAVRRRTAEIGVRMALGAAGRDVTRWIVGAAMRPVLAGAVVGLGGAFMVGRLLRGILFGVAAFDPLTLAAVALTLTGVPLAAALLPARRAARTDPLRVLRAEG